MKHHKILFILIILLGVGSVTLKLLDARDMPQAQKREIDVLTQYLHIRDVIAVDEFDLNREGTFTAHIYRHRHCDGGWMISAMQRNSEGASLFARQAVYGDYRVGDVFYVLHGDIYPQFPEAALWLSQKMAALKNAIGISTITEAVYAVRSFGECQKQEIAS